MNQGRVGEFDSPKNLLANTSSLFFSLWKEAQKIQSARESMIE